MRVQTKGKKGKVLDKEVVVGCGVVVRVPGMRYTLEAEVLEIDEEAQAIRIKAEGKEGIAEISDILDVVDKSAHALNHAINVIGKIKELEL